MRERAINSVAGLVAPEGELLVVTTACDDQPAVEGPPWPLTYSELGLFEDAGLEIISLDEYFGDEPVPVKRLVAMFRRA